MNPDLCDCGYPERQAENMADWDISRAAKSMFDMTSDGRPWPPYPVWHYPQCQSLREYPFEPLNEGACPKCGSVDLRTSYHGKSTWDYTPHHHDYWRTDLYTYRCALTIAYKVTDHLDQSCGRCGFAWLASPIASEVSSA